MMARLLRRQTMSVILDMDLDYFPLFDQPLAELERLLTWAGRPVDFVVEHHHEAFKRWKRMVATHVVQPPHLIIHADEHHDMLSERPPANLGNFLYYAGEQTRSSRPPPRFSGPRRAAIPGWLVRNQRSCLVYGQEARR